MASGAAELVAAVIDRRRPAMRDRAAGPTDHQVVEALRFFVREGVSWRELRATRPAALAAPPRAVAQTAGAPRRCCAGSALPGAGRCARDPRGPPGRGRR